VSKPLLGTNFTFALHAGLRFATCCFFGGRSGTKTGEGKQFALVFRPSSSLKMSTSSNMFAKKMAHTSRWPFDLGYTEWLMLEQDWVSASWVSGSIKNPTEEQVHRFDHETAG